MIAPAFYIKPDYYPDQNPTPANIRTTIVHGFDDDVISCDNSIKFSKLFKTQLYLIEGGHRLNSQRDRLCLLFESFLKDCIAQSNTLFAAWEADNPQTTTPPDGRP
jgi:surfactin synthase thioesterase subunit